MASVKLKSIQIRNWGTIRNASISFPDKGLVLVSGPIGAGKTLVGEAICRSLVGIKGRFASVGHFSHDELGKDTYVKLETTRGDAPLMVELGFKNAELSATGEGLRFTHAGQVMWRDRIESTRNELIKLVGVTPELAAWAVFIDGGIDFTKLSQKDAVDLVMASLCTPPWSKYHDHAKRVLAKFTAEENQAKAAHDEALNNLETAKDEVGDAQGCVDKANDALDQAKIEHGEKLKRGEDRVTKAREVCKIKTDAVAAAQESQRLITAKIRKLESESAEKYSLIEGKKQKVNKKLAQARSFRTTREDRKDAHNATKMREEAALKAMKAAPAACPRCNRPWDQVHSAAEIASQELAIKRANDLVEWFNRLVSEAAADVKVYQGQLAALNEESSKLGVREVVGELSQKFEDLDDQVSRLNRELRLSNGEVRQAESDLATLRLGPDATGVSTAKAVLDERKRQVAVATERINATSVSYSDACEATKVIAYWVEAYGPTGIPNMILRDSVAPLNDISRRVSHMMTEGTLNVSFATTRTLATGENRSQLSIQVDNACGSKRAEGSSKGEKGETNLIVAETFAEVGQVWNRVGFRWYDEVTGNFQPSTRKSFFKYLKETAERLGILIFLVDHHEEAQNYADHILLVSKQAAKTTVLAWQS